MNRAQKAVAVAIAATAIAGIAKAAEEPPEAVKKWFSQVEKVSAEDARAAVWFGGKCGPARQKLQESPTHEAMDEVYRSCFVSSPRR